MAFKVSRLIARERLTGGHVLAGHVLGRAYACVPVPLLDAVESVADCISREQWLDRLGPFVDAPETAFDHLIRSHILIHHSVDEHERLQAGARSLPVDLRQWPFLELVHGNLDLLRSSFGDAELPPLDSVLRLRTGIAVSEIGPDHLLAGHPLGLPTELNRDLWSLANRFRTPSSPRALGIQPSDIPAVGFLLDRGLLARGLSDSPIPPEQFGVSGERGIAAQVPTETRWAQLFRPYTRSSLPAPWTSARICLVGPCQIQALAEAIHHLSREAGLRITITSVLDSELERVDTGVDRVFVTATTYAGELLASLVRDPSGSGVSLIEDFARRIRRLLMELRDRTAAPIVILDLSPPGWWAARPDDESLRHAEHTLVHANDTLRDLIGEIRDCELLGTEAIARGFPGALWDDDLHGSPHHSTIASWNWPVVKPLRSGAFDIGDVFRQPGDLQADPSAPVGAAILENVLRSKLGGLEAIVLDANLVAPPVDPARADWRFTALSDYSDVEDYVFAGLHEALALLKLNGVRIFLLSPESLDTLAARWPATTAMSNSFSPNDAERLIDPDSWREAPNEILTELGAEPCRALFADVVDTRKLWSDCLYWSGPAAELRRLLLSLQKYRPTEARVSHQPSGLMPGAKNEVTEGKLLEILSRLLGKAFGSLDSVGDLRNHGLDSLAVTTLVLEIEEAFGVRLPPSAATEAVVFHPVALARAVAEALARHPLNEPAPSLGSSLSLDLFHRLRDARSSWTLMLVQGPRGGDAEIITAFGLRRTSATWQRAYANCTISRGAFVLIALPLSPDLFGAFFGALFSGFVPILIAPPRNAERDAIATWLLGWPDAKVPGAVVVEPAVQSCCPQFGGVPALSKKDAVDASRTEIWHDELRASDAPLFGICSSGTTDRPKTILHSSATVEARIRGLREILALSARDRLCSWVPAHHTIGVVNMTLLPLLLDIPSVMVDTAAFTRRPALMLDVLQTSRATITFWPNFAMSALARTFGRGGPYRLNVRAWINAGEPLTARVCDEFLAAGGRSHIRAADLSSGYGMAELAGGITQSQPGMGVARLKVDGHSLELGERVLETDDPVTAIELLSSGRVLPGLELEIRGADCVAVGEMEVGAIHVIDHSRPDRSALDTGDIGFLAGSELYVLGRNDGAFQVGGKKVVPEVIEALSESLSGVKKAFAFPVPDARLGTNHLGLAVAASEDVFLEGLESRIRLHLEGALGLTVRHILDAENALVRTSSGKVIRRASAARLLERLRSHERTAGIRNRQDTHARTDL